MFVLLLARDGSLNNGLELTFPKTYFWWKNAHQMALDIERDEAQTVIVNEDTERIVYRTKQIKNEHHSYLVTWKNGVHELMEDTDPVKAFTKYYPREKIKSVKNFIQLKPFIEKEVVDKENDIV